MVLREEVHVNSSWSGWGVDQQVHGPGWGVDQQFMGTAHAPVGVRSEGGLTSPPPLSWTDSHTSENITFRRTSCVIGKNSFLSNKSVVFKMPAVATTVAIKLKFVGKPLHFQKRNLLTTWFINWAKDSQTMFHKVHVLSFQFNLAKKKADKEICCYNFFTVFYS